MILLLGSRIMLKSGLVVDIQCKGTSFNAQALSGSNQHMSLIPSERFIDHCIDPYHVAGPTYTVSVLRCFLAVIGHGMPRKVRHCLENSNSCPTAFGPHIQLHSRKPMV